MIQGNGLTELQTSILMTLTYADLAGRALTLDELHASLFTPREVALSELSNALHNDRLMTALVRHQEGLYFLEDRKSLIYERAQQEMVRQGLLTKAAAFLAVYRNLPTVESVFIAAPALLATPTAGLELFVVAKPGWAWTTVLLGKLLKRMMGVRRLVRIGTVIERGELPFVQRDLFSAQRLATLESPFTGSDLHHLRSQNLWAREYFANSFTPSSPHGGSVRPTSGGRWRDMLLSGLALPLERILEGLFNKPRPTADPEAIEAFDRAWRRQMEKAEMMRRYNEIFA